MTTYHKVEIILSDIHLEALIERLEHLQVTGYTILSIDRSKGPQRGEQQQDGLLPTTHSSLLFTIVPQRTSQALVETIQPFLNRRGGVIIVYPITYASGLQSHFSHEQ